MRYTLHVVRDCPWTALPVCETVRRAGGSSVLARTRIVDFIYYYISGGTPQIC